tara:strand:+ start:2145 stop:2651 length:507 start_codon:yes stop_codon:yes gene_type:complete
LDSFLNRGFDSEVMDINSTWREGIRIAWYEDVEDFERKIREAAERIFSSKDKGRERGRGIYFKEDWGYNYLSAVPILVGRVGDGEDFLYCVDWFDRGVEDDLIEGDGRFDRGIHYDGIPVDNDLPREHHILKIPFDKVLGIALLGSTNQKKSDFSRLFGESSEVGYDD